MLLVDPKVALSVIDMQCKTTTGTALDNLTEQIRFLTARVAAVLETDSLEYGTYRDTFQAPQGRYQPSYGFRLSRAFLTSAPVISVQEMRHPLVQMEYGVVNHSGYLWEEDAPITAQYTAGFHVQERNAQNEAQVPEDPEYRLAVGVPEWLRNVAILTLVDWRRTGFSLPALPKERGANAQIELNQRVDRDLRIRVYGRYTRPRHRLLWPVVSERIT